MRPRAKIGLALGGGFARGIAHIGVLQALQAHQIPVDLVAGTSAGSLVGAIYAAGCDPHQMERLVHEMNWRALVRLRLRRDGLLDSTGLEQFLTGKVGDLSFEELKVPFTAVASDLLDGQEVLLNSGRVATAIRASCAYPGIFLPVRVGKHTLVDGGLTQPVPASVVRRMGADLVIGVELNQSSRQSEPPRNLLGIILASMSLVQQPLIEQALQSADVVVQPDLRDFSLVDLERVAEMVSRGREAAEAAIPAIRERLEALEEADRGEALEGRERST